ncbi:uncharacterized protein BDR25DRAFT_342510 [Lindgomyces ingoldianus]|uniref:Uncharacterized protein n=1 Tax=Lindgomyces ingoldianus TaxID=673940 RepID=A0ACB6QWB4_9PLEO|nr:uncharacterized protein BDR25DRAFT_342510 [Lindgomyces ingoldianus]KAF2471161.1 hypothetical protein BDR25DRAFT_342510 [Lindgomyces ingoldianus]
METLAQIYHTDHFAMEYNEEKFLRVDVGYDVQMAQCFSFTPSMFSCFSEMPSMDCSYYPPLVALFSSPLPTRECGDSWNHDGQKQYIKTYEGRERLDPRYQAVSKHDFFRVGRVFKVLFLESAGRPRNHRTVLVAWTPNNIYFENIRRFVIRKNNRNHCILYFAYSTVAAISALGINRYNNPSSSISEWLRAFTSPLWEPDLGQYKHTVEGVFSVAGFVTSSACLYHWNKDDGNQDYFVLGGISSGIAIGLGTGLELQDILLVILPWTILASMMLSRIVHWAYKSHAEVDDEKWYRGVRSWR